MSRYFDEDELIDGVRIEHGLAFALDTVKKLRQKIAEQKLNIEIYARPFENCRENGLRMYVSYYRGFCVPTMNPLSPVIWLFCDRHTDMPTCLLTTYAHSDYDLYDLHALKNESVNLDFKTADDDAANKILDYIENTVPLLIPELKGEEGESAYDFVHTEWEPIGEDGLIKHSDKLTCLVVPEKDGYRGIIKCELWTPYLCQIHNEDKEEAKRFVETMLMTIKGEGTITLPSPTALPEG